MPRVHKILTRDDILRAMNNTLSNRAAARYLRVSYPHYRKYATLYKDENGVDLYSKHFNRGGRGIPKFTLNVTGRSRREPPIMDLLEGKIPIEHFNPKQIKYKLVTMGLLEPKCSCCGYDTKRIIDNRSPLILTHKNGDKKDWHLDNLAFMCYNCAFLHGFDDVISDKQVERLEDYADLNGPMPDWEPDEYQLGILRSLGLEDKEQKPGEEYISKL